MIGAEQMMRIMAFTYHKSGTWNEEQATPRSGLTFVFVLYGRCMYAIHDKKQVLDKGQYVLIPAGIPYYGRSVPTKIHEKFVIVLEPDASSELPLLQAAEAICTRTGKFDLIADKLRLMYREWQDKQPYAGALCAALLQELFVHMQRERDQAAVKTATTRLVEHMKAYIQDHYREHVTKELLGAHIERSPNYAAALFRKVTGQTISEFVHITRIKTAVYMLRHSALTVTEIAEFIGYNDPSYFYRVFRRQTGLVPTDLVSDREEVRK